MIITSTELRRSFFSNTGKRLFLALASRKENGGQQLGNVNMIYFLFCLKKKEIIFEIFSHLSRKVSVEDGSRFWIRNIALYSYLPNPSARAGYDTKSIF